MSFVRLGQNNEMPKLGNITFSTGCTIKPFQREIFKLELTGAFKGNYKVLKLTRKYYLYEIIPLIINDMYVCMLFNAMEDYNSIFNIIIDCWVAK
jgi:hypothetical protein